MKKILVLFVAVMLAIPAMSYAGSATSRWDLTIGGMVKLDVQWADQAVNQEVGGAERESAAATSSRDKYGAITWGSGETRLNFLIKGPDTWGAKTSAFIEADFRRSSLLGYASSTVGTSDNFGPNTSAYGTFGLRHAFMKFDWPTFSLVMGSTWTLPGALPCFCLLGVNELGPFNKSYFIPQVYGVWQATKEFSVAFGFISPADPIKGLSGSGAPGIAPDDFSRALWPTAFTELVYKTDACGKIGPWMLQFGVGGMFGQEKPITPGSNARTTYRWANGSPNTVNFTSTTDYDDDTVNMWMATFKTYIPIIPEKAPGKMAGSLGLAMTAFTGQNMRTLIPAPPMIQGLQSYNRATNGVEADFHAPVATGGWGQLAFYWTDTVWSGFYYGQTQIALSQARKTQMSPAVTGGYERIQNYVVNLVYDPNPAIRLGLEYGYMTTHYAANANGLKNEGNVNQVRFGAAYFF